MKFYDREERTDVEAEEFFVSRFTIVPVGKNTSSHRLYYEPWMGSWLGGMIRVQGRLTEPLNAFVRCDGVERPVKNGDWIVRRPGNPLEVFTPETFKARFGPWCDTCGGSGTVSLAGKRDSCPAGGCPAVKAMDSADTKVAVKGEFADNAGGDAFVSVPSEPRRGVIEKLAREVADPFGEVAAQDLEARLKAWDQWAERVTTLPTPDHGHSSEDARKMIEKVWNDCGVLKERLSLAADAQSGLVAKINEWREWAAGQIGVDLVTTAKTDAHMRKDLSKRLGADERNDAIADWRLWALRLLPDKPVSPMTSDAELKAGLAEKFANVGDHLALVKWREWAKSRCGIRPQAPDHEIRTAMNMKIDKLESDVTSWLEWAASTHALAVSAAGGADPDHRRGIVGAIEDLKKIDLPVYSELARWREWAMELLAMDQSKTMANVDVDAFLRRRLESDALKIMLGSRIATKTEIPRLFVRKSDNDLRLVMPNGEVWHSCHFDGGSKRSPWFKPILENGKRMKANDFMNSGKCPQEWREQTVFAATKARDELVEQQAKDRKG